MLGIFIIFIKKDIYMSKILTLDNLSTIWSNVNNRITSKIPQRIRARFVMSLGPNNNNPSQPLKCIFHNGTEPTMIWAGLNKYTHPVNNNTINGITTYTYIFKLISPLLNGKTPSYIKCQHICNHAYGSYEAVVDCIQIANNQADMIMTTVEEGSMVDGFPDLGILIVDIYD